MASLSSDGTVLGEPQFAHDHAGEQPFTRTHTGLKIPEGIDETTVKGEIKSTVTAAKHRYGRCDPGMTGPRRWVIGP